MSLIFVGHDLIAVKTLCRETIVLHQGAVHFRGDSKEAVNLYHELHSASARRSLRAAVPERELAPMRRRNWQSTDEIGAREAEFISCEVLDEQKQPRRQFAEGEGICVRLHIQASSEIPALHAGFQVVDRHNRALYGLTTLHRESPGLHLSAGATTVLEIEVPGLLGAGEYLVDVAIGWGDRGDGAFAHTCHRVGGIAALAVGRTSPRPLFLGPVDLNGEIYWRDQPET